MWLFQGGPQSPGEIRALVLELLGLKVGGILAEVRENYVARETLCSCIGRFTHSFFALQLFESDERKVSSCSTG